jgi:alpha/beta superfamily hydrolase
MKRIILVHAMAASLAVVLAAPSAGQMGDPMASVRGKVGKPDLVEQYGKDALQSGELRLPAGKGPFPVAMVVHGGCWDKGYEDRSGLAPLAEALTRRGIATWNISYRRTGDAGGGWPGTFEDLASAGDHLRKLAERHPLDLKRSAFVGHSAGAHLALWAASRHRLGGRFAADAFRPSAVAAIDGPGSLTSFAGVDKDVCGKPVIAALMGGTPAERAEEYKLASPAEHLPLGTRTLLVKGSLAFTLDPYEAAAKAKGETVLSLAPAGADHFNIVTPGTSQGDAVADWLAANLFATGTEAAKTTAR